MDPFYIQFIKPERYFLHGIVINFHSYLNFIYILMYQLFLTTKYCMAPLMDLIKVSLDMNLVDDDFSSFKIILSKVFLFLFSCPLTNKFINDTY